MKSEKIKTIEMHSNNRLSADAQDFVLQEKRAASLDA
jgi:hypothetical protein